MESDKHIEEKRNELKLILEGKYEKPLDLTLVSIYDPDYNPNADYIAFLDFKKYM